jgi:hypothetical protein
MPLYMDIHEVPGGVSAEDVAKAHTEDVKIEDKYGVHYHKYWVNEKAGKIFCLCHAPDAEAATQVHREAHGMVADKIIEIQPELAEGFLGGVEVNEAGAALVPGATNERDPGIRTVLFTDIVDSTTLTQSLGDEAALAMLGVHDTIVRDALSASGGREVKHTGDGIMAAFISAAGAVRCAIQIQRELDKHAQANPERPLVKVGAAAEPVEQHNDLWTTFNWPPVSALMRAGTNSVSNVPQTSASAKDCCSKTWAKWSPKASVTSPRPRCRMEA